MLIKTCSQCGKKGILLRLNADAVCSACESTNKRIGIAAAKSFINNYSAHITAATDQSVIFPGLGYEKIKQQYDECIFVLEHIEDWKNYPYFEDAFYETLEKTDYSWFYSPLFAKNIIWQERQCNDLHALFDNLKKTTEKLRFDCMLAKDKAYDYSNIFQVVGVTFKNGRKHRQTILRKIRFSDPPYQYGPDFELRYYRFNDEDAFGVFAKGEQVGNISREDIPWLREHWNEYVCVNEYDITGGSGLNYGLMIRVGFRKNEQ